MATSSEDGQVHRPLWLSAAPVLFLTFWSGGFVFAKLGLAHAEPLTFLAVRFAIVAAAMAGAWVILRPPLPGRPMDWLHLAIIGVLMQTLYFGFTYISFDSGTSAGLVAMILAFQPILAGMLSPVLTGERVGWRQWTGLALGLCGTAIVIIARLEIAVPPTIGLIAAVLALLSFLAATLWEKKFGRDHHPASASLIQFTAGFLVLLPFALVLEKGEIAWNVDLGIALAYLVICNSLIATTLLLAMIRAGAVARVSALLFLVPPVSALMAWGLLDEVMPVMAWPGMALAAIGVVVATART